MKNVVRLAIVFAIGCFLISSRSAQADPISELPEVVVRNLKAPILRVLASADHVEAFRVKGERLRDAPKTLKELQKRPSEIWGFPVIGAVKKESKEFGRNLFAALIKKDNYNSGVELSKACGFSPGVAFRAWSGEEAVDVLVCFHCNQAVLVRYDAKGNVAERKEIEIDFIRPDLLRLAQQAFPGDPALN